MIITKSFIWIDNPVVPVPWVGDALRALQLPTAGGFFRFMGKREPELREIKDDGLTNIFSRTRCGLSVGQVPKESQHLPVLSIWREPVPCYEFLFHGNSWRQQDQIGSSGAEGKNQVIEFLDFLDAFHGETTLDVGGQSFVIGFLSAEFLVRFAQPLHVEPARIVFDSWDQLVQGVDRTSFLSYDKIVSDLLVLFTEWGIPFGALEPILKIAHPLETAPDARPGAEVEGLPDWEVYRFSDDRLQVTLPR